MVTRKFSAVALGAWLVAVGATCSLTHDVDGISERGAGGESVSGTGGHAATTGAVTTGAGGLATTSAAGATTGDGGMSAGGGALPGSGGATTVATTDAATAETATTDVASSSTTCTEPAPCGLEGQPCCQCSTACTDNSSCDGTLHCSGCGALGQPPCGTACDGVWMRPISGVCRHCCVKCQGQGTGDAASGHPVNPDQGDGDCGAAADKNCDNLKACGTNDAGECCPDCVNVAMWDVCDF